MKYKIIFKTPNVLDQLDELKLNKDTITLETFRSDEIEEFNKDLEDAKEILKEHLLDNESICIEIDTSTKEINLFK